MPTGRPITPVLSEARARNVSTSITACDAEARARGLDRVILKWIKQLTITRVHYI